MGSTIRRCGRTAAMGLVAVALGSMVAWATGIGIGVSSYPLDLAPALGKLPSAVSSSLSSLGVSSTDAAGILGEIDGAIAELQAALPVSSIPVPTLSAAVEVSVPWVVIDDLRFAGGFASDGLVRGIAAAIGQPLPSPLVSAEFAMGTTTGGVTLDPTFRTFHLSAEAVKRLDLFLLAFDLGAGLDYVQGAIDPGVVVQAPLDQSAAVAAALDALHPDDLYWANLGAHGRVAVEIGPPFLRTVVGVAGYLPLGGTSGWWGLGLGEWSVSVGWVIRF